MIRPSKEQILISRGDGSVETFSTDELQSRIYQACIECGFEDSWLSEDIALSVEYLILGEGDRREFSMEEIFLFASRLLEDTGHGSIAYNFRKNCNVRDATQSSDFASVKLFLSKQVPGIVDEELERIATLVSSALKVLGINDAHEALLLSFAKHYRGDALAKIAENFENTSDRAAILLTREQINNALREIPRAVPYISGGILSFHPVSRLFPSVKISMSFAKFAKMKGLSTPLTELALASHFGELSDVIEELKSRISSTMSPACEISLAELPIILRITDSREFTRDYMGVVSDEDKCMHGILSCFREFIPSDIIIK